MFTDTVVPEEILKMDNVEYGGTGFYYDKAPKLPEAVEHIFPDYHLYDEYVKEQVRNGTDIRLSLIHISEPTRRS